MTLVAFSVTGFVVGTTAKPANASGGNRRNLIRIYGDDVGPGEVGAYGLA